ncbi:MAG: hypothetical protein ACEQSX_00430 [Baekduiaceae bacterium]
MHQTLADLTDAALDERIRYTAPDHPSAEPLRVERARRSMMKSIEMAKVAERLLLPIALRSFGCDEAARWAVAGYLRNATPMEWLGLASEAYYGTPPTELERDNCVELIATGASADLS